MKPEALRKIHLLHELHAWLDAGSGRVFPNTDLLFNCFHEKSMCVKALFGSYLVSQDSLLHHPGIVVEFHA